MNDGSTDNTAQILKEAEDRDARVIYCQNTGSKSCAGARNTGMSMASGDYIAFLDDDDEYYPDKIASELDILACPHALDRIRPGIRWNRLYE